MITDHAFDAAFKHFERNLRAKRGEVFVSFDEGLPEEWEGYKPRVRERALDLLGLGAWDEGQVGSGEIRERAIRAIEISEGDLRNNLVRWQNRWGPESKSHRRLLEARDDKRASRDIERALFGLYVGNEKDSSSFDELTTLFGKRYDLISYLYFLKDAGRFMPIAPTRFDKAFEFLGIELVTTRKCSWSNYDSYNRVLGEVAAKLRVRLGTAVPLIDAHSFLWMLVSLDGKPDRLGKAAAKRSPRERSIARMVKTTRSTARQSQLGPRKRTRKKKELRLTEAELEETIQRLLKKQGGKCALTGIRLLWDDERSDKQLLPSLDRIDSDGHYERENLQVVCRFINFWKGSYDDAEFRRLLGLVLAARSN